MTTNSWHIVGKIMLSIVNKSLQTRVFAENWNTAMVTPIEKVAKTKRNDEYRPINTLKTCEKIMKKVVKEQLKQ